MATTSAAARFSGDVAAGEHHDRLGPHTGDPAEATPA